MAISKDANGNGLLLRVYSTASVHPLIEKFHWIDCRLYRIRCTTQHNHISSDFIVEIPLFGSHINLTLLTVIGWFSIEKWLSVFCVSCWLLRPTTMRTCKLVRRLQCSFWRRDIFANNIFSSLFMFMIMLLLSLHLFETLLFIISLSVKCFCMYTLPKSICNSTR